MGRINNEKHPFNKKGNKKEELKIKKIEAETEIKEEQLEEILQDKESEEAEDLGYLQAPDQKLKLKLIQTFDRYAEKGENILYFWKDNKKWWPIESVLIQENSLEAELLKPPLI